MRKALFAGAIAISAGVGIAGPSSASMVTSAGTATVSAVWQDSCSVLRAESTKDISNIVYRLDGIDTKIELTDGIRSYELPGEVTDVWIKSGRNLSLDSAGYGDHFTRPATCTQTADATSTAPETQY